MITNFLKLTQRNRLKLAIAGMLCLCMLAGAEEPTPKEALVTMQFSDTDLRDLIIVVAEQAGTDVLLTKAVRKRANVNCENEPGQVLLERLAEELGLRSCAVGAVTVFYEFPHTNFRVYHGQDNYTDLFPEAARVYRERLANAAETMITVKASDIDLMILLSDIARQAGVEIREGHPVRGNVWVDLSNVPASDAFTAVVMVNGFGVTVEDGVWVVGKPESFSVDN